jgi:hypothetical protein
MVPSNPRGRGVPSTAAVTIARIFAIQPKRSGYLLRDNIEVLYFEVLHYFEFSLRGLPQVRYWGRRNISRYDSNHAYLHGS